VRKIGNGNGNEIPDEIKEAKLEDEQSTLQIAKNISEQAKQVYYNASELGSDNDLENTTLRDSVFTVERITFDRLHKLTEEQQIEHHKVVSYLLTLDFTKEVNLLGLSNLAFELSEDEDSAFMTKPKTAVYKILKVLLYYMGLTKGKMAYEREQLDKMIQEKFTKQQEEIKVFLDGLKDYQSTSMFEMQQFTDKFLSMKNDLHMYQQSQDDRFNKM